MSLAHIFLLSKHPLKLLQQMKNLFLSLKLKFSK